MSPAPVTRRKPAEPTFRLSEEILAALRQRIDTGYYDRPEVKDVLARKILAYA